MKIAKKNDGILSVEQIKTGDKLIILEPAYENFVESKQVTYINCKVELPNGDHKLASFFDTACNLFIDKWGEESESWVGHTIDCEIKTSKAGKPYIVMTPSDDPIVKIEAETKVVADDSTDVSAKHIAKTGGKVEYPSETINPDDIPF